MPNRILRDCCDSEAVDSLSVQAERHFYRLIMKVDDFGRLRADAKILRPLIYPLKLDEVREADLQRWNAECVKAGLIRLYDHGQKSYLEIQNFKQRTRSSQSKYPGPGDSCRSHDGHVTVIRRSNDGRLLTETETETYSSSETGASDDDLSKTDVSKIVSSLQRAHEIGPKDRSLLAELLKTSPREDVIQALEDAEKRGASRPISYASEILSRNKAKKLSNQGSGKATGPVFT